MPPDAATLVVVLVKPVCTLSTPPAIEAARLRLRPILMTSFAFILGVVPLVRATGAGSEMRQALGPVVFFGMLGVTIFGLLFTPAFYTFIRKLGSRGTLETESAELPIVSRAGIEM